MAKKQTWIVRMFDDKGRLYDYFTLRNKTYDIARQRAVEEVHKREEKENIWKWDMGIKRKKLKKVV